MMENFKGGPTEVQDTQYTPLSEFHASLGRPLVPDFVFNPQQVNHIRIDLQQRYYG